MPRGRKRKIVPLSTTSIGDAKDDEYLKESDKVIKNLEKEYANKKDKPKTIREKDEEKSKRGRKKLTEEEKQEYRDKLKAKKDIEDGKRKIDSIDLLLGNDYKITSDSYCFRLEKLNYPAKKEKKIEQDDTDTVDLEQSIEDTSEPYWSVIGYYSKLEHALEGFVLTCVRKGDKSIKESAEEALECILKVKDQIKNITTFTITL
jgi:hypothetical protein